MQFILAFVDIDFAAMSAMNLDLNSMDGLRSPDLDQVQHHRFVEHGCGGSLEPFCRHKGGSASSCSGGGLSAAGTAGLGTSPPASEEITVTQRGGFALDGEIAAAISRSLAGEI